ELRTVLLRVPQVCFLTWVLGFLFRPVLSENSRLITENEEPYSYGLVVSFAGVSAGAAPLMYMIFFVPPPQVPTTLPSASLSLSTMSSVYDFTPFASSFAAISVFNSSQGFAACACAHTGTNNSTPTVANNFMVRSPSSGSPARPAAYHTLPRGSVIHACPEPRRVRLKSHPKNRNSPNSFFPRLSALV